jgi:hypothetical protein
MGLFDSYFDPRTFSDENSNESGGLLGRLLSLQQQQSQYQPGAGFDQSPSSPQTPDYGQAQNLAISGYQMPQFGRADISQPLQQPTDLGDRLSAGFQSWARTPVGSPLASLANGIAGFGSGLRTDQTGITPAQARSPTSDIGDRLSAGFQNWAHTPVGNPMAAIANGIAGLGSGQRITDSAPQTPQARLAALKFLLGDRDATPTVPDPQVGNPLMGQPLARSLVNYAAPAAGNFAGSPREPRANVPWSVKPNVQSWSVR